jgi:O-succinylbenzoic acid--CoA ligase
MDEERVTIVSLVSTMLRRVITERGDKPFPPTLRCVLLGGGPAPRDLLSECARLKIPVSQTYGLTEAASQVATLAPQDALRKFGSAGKPLMGVELKIEREDENEEVGEIVIRGAAVMREYWNDPEATARALRDGWLHTGDLGYLDEDGYLFVAARREDLIVSGGENIYPAEIESALNAHPAVLESAVVGVEDPEWQQVPVAYLVLREGEQVSREELSSYCIECMARFKVPAQFQFVESLPRNAAGKLLRQQLVADWHSRYPRQN